MIARRSLIGGLLAGLAAPAVIRTPGLLMPVKVPVRTRHLLTEADIDWSMTPHEMGFVHGVGGTWRSLDGTLRRHATAFPLSSLKQDGPVMYDQAKAAIVKWANRLDEHDAGKRRTVLA